MADDKQHSKTDDDRAREAAENPLGTARRPGPLPGLHGLSWGGPIAAVVIALVVLAIFVTVLV